MENMLQDVAHVSHRTEPFSEGPINDHEPGRRVILALSETTCICAVRMILNVRVHERRARPVAPP